tara:strand:- start:1403 stop:1954 length:552 start_codon:yes stop_codon:yes gene_type:complete
MAELTKTLAVIQTELKAKKSSYNAFGKYYFRKAEDILEAAKPFLTKHNVYVKVDESIISVDPVPMMQSTATISNGKESITATAIVGVDLNQKGMQTSQQFGAASTYGKKYALGNLFLIDDTEDADATNNHGKTAAPKVVKKKITDAQMAKAKDFVSNGGGIKAILANYTMSPAELAELKKLVK